MKAYLLVAFSSYLASAAETLGETCSEEQLEGTEGDSLLQSRPSSLASASTKNKKDTPMEYPILAAGVDDPRASLLQTRQTPDDAVATESNIDAPMEPMEYDTKGELVGMDVAKRGQKNLELQSEESYNLDQNGTSSNLAATDLQNDTSTRNGMAAAVLASTESPGLTAEVVFGVSAMMTMMISTMLLRTESAMIPPMKTKSLGRTMMEAESSK